MQEPSECERDACRSVGWRLQASWRLPARRPDDAVQSRQTAASFIPLSYVKLVHLYTNGYRGHIIGSAFELSTFILPRFRLRRNQLDLKGTSRHHCPAQYAVPVLQVWGTLQKATIAVSSLATSLSAKLLGYVKFHASA
jgi:hypothetical protein